MTPSNEVYVWLRFLRVRHRWFMGGKRVRVICKMVDAFQKMDLVVLMSSVSGNKMTTGMLLPSRMNELGQMDTSTGEVNTTSGRD